MGQDWILKFKSEIGEYIDVPHPWPCAPSRYYGIDHDGEWYEVGQWPVIQEMLLNTLSEYRSPIYYGGEVTENEKLEKVTPELLDEINKHWIETTRGKK